MYSWLRWRNYKELHQTSVDSLYLRLRMPNWPSRTSTWPMCVVDRSSLSRKLRLSFSRLNRSLKITRPSQKLSRTNSNNHCCASVQYKRLKQSSSIRWCYPSKETAIHSLQSMRMSGAKMEMSSRWSSRKVRSLPLSPCCTSFYKRW